MTHPYRTCPLREMPRAEDDGARLAFAVVAFAGLVEIAIAGSAAELVFGASACAAGLYQLAGSRRR